MSEQQPAKHTPATCVASILSVKDALDVVHGRWTILIILSLSSGTKRFKEIARELKSITDKVLSKELKELEINQLIKRTVHDTFPPMVEYSITEHGKTLEKVITELGNWGSLHRKTLFGR